MSTHVGVGGMVGSVRRRAWDAGGVVLLALGIGSIGVALAGLILGGGGVAFFPLAVPPLAAGYGVIRRVRWARVFGFIIAGAYAVGVAYVATTPWRGLTPPPGQSPASIDPGSVFVALAFSAATILVVCGEANLATDGR